MKEVWCETFPDEEGNSKRKIQRRKGYGYEVKINGIILRRD